MEGTIAEIRLFAGNFAPRAWAFCNGQIMAIAQNTALFSLLGTNYGGNGQTTFALPDFRGRVAIGTGQGPGLSNYNLAQVGGQETVTLTINNMPSHNHSVTGTVAMQANNDSADLTSDPTGRRLAATGNLYTSQSGDLVNMAIDAVNLTTTINGGGQPFSTIQSYLAMNYIICLQGIFPSRN